MDHAARTASRVRLRWPLLALLAAVMIVPPLFWKQVWFGSRLSDEQITQCLSKPEEPRRLQHACEQISRRMQRDPAGALQFYDLLAALADHPDPQIRYVVAWCLGEDNSRYVPFHQALLRLVTDEAPRVRYNAALALVRFGDPAGRPVLRQMLMPCRVSAQWQGPAREGTLADVLRQEDPVRVLMQLALVDTGEGEPQPILSPLDGHVGQVMVPAGGRIGKGDALCTISPDLQQVWQALRALTVVGEPEDLEHVQRYLALDGRSSRRDQARIRTQARLTAEAIRKRAEHQRQDKQRPRAISTRYLQE